MGSQPPQEATDIAAVGDEIVPAVPVLITEVIGVIPNQFFAHTQTLPERFLRNH